MLTPTGTTRRRASSGPNTLSSSMLPLSPLSPVEFSAPNSSLSQEAVTSVGSACPLVKKELDTSTVVNSMAVKGVTATVSMTTAAMTSTTATLATSTTMPMPTPTAIASTMTTLTSTPTLVTSTVPPGMSLSSKNNLNCDSTAIEKQTPVSIGISVSHTAMDKKLSHLLSHKNWEPFPATPAMPPTANDTTTIEPLRPSKLPSTNTNTTTNTNTNTNTNTVYDRRRRRRANTFNSRPGPNSAESAPSFFSSDSTAETIAFDQDRIRKSFKDRAALVPLSIPIPVVPSFASGASSTLAKPRRRRANTTCPMTVQPTFGESQQDVNMGLISPTTPPVATATATATTTATMISDPAEESNDISSPTVKALEPRPFERYPSVGELLWHNSHVYSDVHLSFEDDGQLADTCSLPRSLHLHSLILLQSRFFRERLNATTTAATTTATGPNNPIKIVISLPRLVSRTEMISFHLAIKLMYTKQFAQELADDMERAIGVLGVCYDIGFKEGIQSCWCWLAQRCLRKNQNHTWERLCEAYPTLERKYRPILDTPVLRAMRRGNDSPRSVGGFKSSGFTADEPLKPMAWPNLSIGASSTSPTDETMMDSISTATSTSSTSTNTTTTANAASTTLSKTLLPNLRVDVLDKLPGSGNNQEASPNLSPSCGLPTPEIASLENTNDQNSFISLPSPPPLLSPTILSSLSPTTLTSCTASPTSNAMSPTSPSTCRESSLSLPSPSVNHNGNGPHNVMGVRGRRRSSFNPPRPSAQVLAKCSEPNDPSTARRRLLTSWLTAFEARTLAASVSQHSNARDSSSGESNGRSIGHSAATLESRATSPSRHHRRTRSPSSIPPLTCFPSILPEKNEVRNHEAMMPTLSPPGAIPNRRRRDSVQSPASHLLDTVRQLVESGDALSAEAFGYTIRILDAVRVEAGVTQFNGTTVSEALDRSLAGVVRQALAEPERIKLYRWLQLDQTTSTEEVDAVFIGDTGVGRRLPFTIDALRQPIVKPHHQRSSTAERRIAVAAE